MALASLGLSALQVKEGKEKTGKEKTGATNVHQFVPVSPSGPSGLSVYVACDKPVPGKEFLQCTSEYCTFCRSLFPVGDYCSGLWPCLITRQFDSNSNPLRLLIRMYL